MPRAVALLAGLLALAPAVAAAQTADAAPPAVRVVVAFQDAWNAGSADRAFAFFASNPVVVDPQGGGTHTGRDAVYQWLADQLGRQTSIISAGGYSVSGGAAGDNVRWMARLSNFSTRNLRAPPIDVTMETVVRDGKIVSHTITPDGDSLGRQRAAVRDAFATRTALVDADGPATLPPLPTQPPYQAIALPNVSQRRAPVQLPWLAVGGVSLAGIALAAFKRPPRM